MSNARAMELTWVAYIVTSVRRKRERLEMSWTDVEWAVGHSENHLAKDLRRWSDGAGMTLATASRLMAWVKYDKA
jgi:hypothetical protein